MKKSKQTKKSLQTSLVSLLLCLAMLVGTTFAWFTDSISNKGNIIQSGNLDIGAFAYDVDADGDKTITIDNKDITFEKTGEDLETSQTPILNEQKWEPGISNAKLLEVTNKGTLATKIKLDFAVNDGGLQEALWFDFVMVDDNNQVVGSFNKRPMSQLQTMASQVEIKLLTKQSTKFVFIYGMNEEAGNEYQNKTFNVDVTILATQAVEESDGFGNNQYDKDSKYPIEVKNQQELKKALANAKAGDIIDVTDDFTLEHTGNHPDGTNDTYLIQENVTIDLNGHTITMSKGGQTEVLGLAANGIHLKGGKLNIQNNNGTYPLYVTAGAKDVIIEDMIIDGGIQVVGNSSATLKNVTINATNYYDVYLEHNSQVIVESGTYNHTGDKPHFYTATASDKVIVNGGIFSGGTPTHRGNGTFVNNLK